MEKKIQISQKLLMAAIAGILFFSFLIRKTPYYQTTTQEERDFLNHYIQIGKKNLIFFLINSVIVGISFFFQHIIFDILSNIISLCILIISVFSVFFAIGGYYITFQRDPNLPSWKILKCFLPLYNFSLRYQKDDYQTPSRWLKESMFWWSLLIITRLLFGIKIGVIISILFILRITLLWCQIDLVPNTMKKDLNKLFLIYPQEICSYLLYEIYQRRKKEENPDYLIEKKGEYQTRDQGGFKTLLQYTLFVGIIIGISFIKNKGLILTTETIIQMICFCLWILSLIIHHKYKQWYYKIPFLHELFTLFK